MKRWFKKNPFKFDFKIGTNKKAPFLMRINNSSREDDVSFDVAGIRFIKDHVEKIDNVKKCATLKK